MKKQQLYLLSGGFLLLILLYFFGNQIPPPKPIEALAAKENKLEKAVSTEKLIAHAKEKLTPGELQYIISLENTVKRGDVKNQQIKAYRQLAAYWKDTLRLFEPYAYYTSEAAKLENSEKSLTFAAHLFLSNLQTEPEPAMQNWLATNAKVLFEKALVINPANDSSVVGLGACYLFGNVSDNPMQGIRMIKDVLQKNPDNLFAHMMLGLGGIKSGQVDKAIEHFKFILEKQPRNVEAALNLAEAYDRHGDKAEAVKWYQVVKGLVNNTEAQKELDNRIKAIK